MNAARGPWATTRRGLVAALVLVFASGLAYPGGTLRDESTRGYSITHNFLSDLGATVALNYQSNVAGAVLFGVAAIVGVLALVISIAATVRLLSATPRARSFARLAAAVGILTCVGFLGSALVPVDQAWGLHRLMGIVGFRSLAAVAALLAIATARDARFRRRAAVGWAALAIVLVGIIVASLTGPAADTDRGLAIQVILQKIMVASILVTIWLECVEAEMASAGSASSVSSGTPSAATAG